jgi:DNA-binding helix-hairpin-helix protein with protein kinase domain
LSAKDGRPARWTLDWDGLRAIARNLALRIGDIHADGLVVADLSAANVMVTATGQVAIVDCDDMLWYDQLRGGAKPLTSPGYTAPEILRSDSSAASPSSDRWALAVLICRLLLDGSHPFEVAPTHRSEGGQATVDDNVAAFRTRFRRTTRLGRRFGHSAEALDGAVPLDVLPDELLDLARRCFHDGDKDPHARPRAQEWLAALDKIKVTRCEHVPTHKYSRHLDSCPWCVYAEHHRVDPFPGAWATTPAGAA